MSTQAFPTQRLQFQFLPAVPGTNAAGSAAAAAESAAAAAASASDAISTVGNKVDRTGDTMSGFLTLNADPTAGLHAATKHYVDVSVGSGAQIIGTPTMGQHAIFADAFHLQGVTADYALVNSPTFTGDPKAPTPTAGDNDTSIATTAFVQGAIATRQPLDGDLTSLAAAGATNAIYYRSAADTWSQVTIGTNMTFSGGVLAATGTGNVLFSGTPSAGQIAVWTDPTHIQGVVGTTLFQPLDGDLTSLAAAAGTNTLYYRSAANTWSPVIIGPNMTFVGGTLNSAGGGAGSGNVNSSGTGFSTSTLTGYADTTGNVIRAITLGTNLTLAGTTLNAASGGNVNSTGTPTNGQLAQWTDATHIQGIAASSLGFAPLASPVFTGDPQAPTPAAADNDTSIATTAFVNTAITTVLVPFAPLASPTFTGDPKAPTPGTADNDTSIATTAFVKAQNYITSTALVPYALLANPVFTGDPQAPTPAIGDNDTSIATTAFVQTLIAALWSTGDLKITHKTTADPGWILWIDGTIGSATSGSSIRANADTQPLFNLYYVNYSNADCPLFTSTGASTTRAAQGTAGAAFAANCRMSLPKGAARALMLAGVGSGLTTRTLGSAFGVESFVQTPAQMPAHAHTATALPHTHTFIGGSSGSAVVPLAGYNPGANLQFAGTNGVEEAGIQPADVSISLSNTGGGNPMNVMNPHSVVNVMVRL